MSEEVTDLIALLRDMSHREAFSVEDMKKVGCAAAVVYTVAFIIGYSRNGKRTVERTNKKTGEMVKKADKKIMTWSISVVNSFAVSVLGCIYMCLHFTEEGSYIPTFPPSGTPEVKEMLHGKDDLGTICCIIFGVANIMDTLCGQIFYPENLSFLTTYFHHGVFTWLMVCAVTTQGGFITTETTFVPSFVMALPEEIPTFLLALGSLDERFRSDLAFGVTFFILRIVYHAFLLYYVIVNKMNVVTIGMYVLAMTLHVVWFKGWCTGAGSKYMTWLLGPMKSKDE
jgi:hypothetical protein